MNQLTQLSQLTGFIQNLTLDNFKMELANIQGRFSNLRGPQDFFDFKRASKPANFSEIQQRISYNLRYYGTNYALIVGCLSIYTLIRNLLLLFVIVFTLFGVLGINKLQGQDLVTPFGTYKSTQLYTGLMLVAIPLGFLASPISTLMWLIGASAVTVLGHATLLEKPIETVFEEQV